MLEFSLEDTIIAISTPPGYGGIGVIRLSGIDALKIAKRMFRAKKAGAKILPRQAVFGNLMDFESQEAVDEGYCLFFPEPHSYTKENVVEISCHGGPVVMEEALRLGIRAGARHAHPGEFTWRAYVRGRIDILQAEAINGLIRADSIIAAKLAFNQIDGSLSKKIARLRAQTLDLISRIEATIEFPDDVIPVSSGGIALSLGKMVAFLADLVSSYNAGKALTDGVTLAITGRTNVGKSTLFNAILEDERAIVTPFAGTTRDYIKEKIKIKDTFFNLVDMAGLGKPASAIEKEGIKRSKIIASQADGLLMLLDISRKEKAEDFALLEEFRGKKALLVFNKIDLPKKMNAAQIKKRFKDFPSLEISALKGTNLKRLKRKIQDVFAPELGDRDEIIFHIRQKLQLEEILRHFEKGLELLESGYPEEFCAEEIRAAIPLIGRLTGEIRAEDVIQHIFSKFCLGK
jgi:tRNA modification GTPase